MLDRELRIELPEAVEGLVAELPALDGPPDIIAWYDTKRTGRPRVYCAICKGHHHFKGLVIGLGEGKHALVGGSVCGKRHFGLSWTVIERDFNREVDRRYDLRRLVRLRGCIGDVLTFADRVEACGIVAAIDDYRDGLRRRFGALSQAIAKVARLDGRLELPEDYRDREAEEALARKRWPDLVAEVEGPSVNRALARKELDRLIEQSGRVVKSRPRLVGVLSGRDLFGTQRAAVLIGGPVAEIRALASILQGDLSGDALNGNSLASLLKRFVDAVTALEQALRLADALEAFCDVDSLTLVVGWGNQMPGVEARLKLDGATLVDKVSQARLEPPRPSPPPPISDLEPFWSALRLADGE